MNNTLSVTDMFCGCGGSSQGAHEAIQQHGGEIKLAMNHWKLAIETHNSNFPDTRHDCSDISAADPRRFPSSTILIASPECTNHSLAKGQKQVRSQLKLYETGQLDPAAERSRATMWDVPRFAECHKYKMIICENVVDARNWIMYPAWIKAMELLGYDYKECFINSMHCHPTPQSRDRMYVVFWQKGIKAPDLEFRPEAYCPECETKIRAVQRWKNKKWGKYKTQYVYACPTHNIKVEPYYYASFNAIDWSIPGTRIGDRKKQLAPNTIKRIRFGLEKYKGEFFQVINYSPGTAKSMADPLQSITTKDHHGVCHRMALVVPWTIDMNSTGSAKPSNRPLATVTAGGINQAVLIPFIPVARGQSKALSGLDPLPTQSQMINSGVVTSDKFNAFISQYYGCGNGILQMTDPFGTFSTVDRSGLVSYEVPELDDCFYRMLKPHEVQAGMAFASDYTVLGNSKDQVKQLGNAVTPPVMKWLVGRCIRSLM